jgi:hypothetical protein
MCQNAVQHTGCLLLYNESKGIAEQLAADFYIMSQRAVQHNWMLTAV